MSGSKKPERSARPRRYRKDNVSKDGPIPVVFRAKIASLEEFKYNYVMRVIAKLGGDKPEAARRLEISLGTIYNLLKRAREGHWRLWWA
jgi:DNA-binding NtrC family response regulator